jgi:hypothetical protein
LIIEEKFPYLAWQRYINNKKKSIFKKVNFFIGIKRVLKANISIEMEYLCIGKSKPKKCYLCKKKEIKSSSKLEKMAKTLCPEHATRVNQRLAQGKAAADRVIADQREADREMNEQIAKDALVRRDCKQYVNYWKENGFRNLIDRAKAERDQAEFVARYNRDRRLGDYYRSCR